MDVLAQRDLDKLVMPSYPSLQAAHQTTNNSSQIEDHPEPGDVFSLGFLRWIAHHDGSLGSPQYASTNTQIGTSEDSESIVLVVGVGEEGCDVDGITWIC